MRKIIQIAAAYNELSGGSVIVALCDDGSLWEIGHRLGQYEWEQVIPIPQDHEPDAAA